MDTIHNIATAASKAIWGESQSHEEPVSGKMGNVAAGEPYDAGNIGEPNEAALSPTEKQETEGPAGTSTPSSTTKPSGGPETATAAAASKTDTKTRSADDAERPAGEEGKPSSTFAKDSQKSGKPASPAGPAEAAPSAQSMRDDSTKVQNDTRPPAPSSGEASSSDSKKGEQALAERTLKKPDSENPDVKVEGSGPRPLEDIAREHGGDAGAAKPGAESQSGNAAPAGAAAATAGGKKQAEAEGTSTHQRRDSGKSVGANEGSEAAEESALKSSRLAADGGDFDAARAGAGREADRLLEEKGLHKGEDAQGAHHGSRSGTGGSGKEKTKLKDKIKAKLHKNVMSV